MDLPDFQNAIKWWKAFKAWPLRYRIFLIIAAVAIVCILVLDPFIRIFFNEEPVNEPERAMFLVTNPNIRVGSKIIIAAENDAADLNRVLKVEYDGIVFPIGGIPISGSYPQMWYCTLHDKELPEDMLKEGVHQLRFSFLGGDFSDSSKIIISKKAPVPFIDIAELDISNLENAEIQTIEVHTARDLIKAIKPNTIIKLAKGTYNLSLASQVKSKYVVWSKVYDGFEPLIHSIYNFKIIGQPGAKILIEPMYAWVMSFQNSKNIKLENLIAGHAVAGYCTGGVLSFVNSEDIEISNSVLFGCGTTGIQMDKVDSFTCRQTLINHCTYNLLGVYNSVNILFQNCAFTNSRVFNLIEIGNFTYNANFSSCLFVNNRTGFHMPYLVEVEESTNDVSIVESVFLDNKAQNFVRREHNIALKDNTFLYNSFSEIEVVGLYKALIQKFPLGYRFFAILDEKMLVTCKETNLEEFSGKRFDIIDWESAKLEVGEKEIEIILPDFSSVGLLLENRKVSIRRNVGDESRINCTPDREVVVELLFDKGRNLIVVIGLRDASRL